MAAELEIEQKPVIFLGGQASLGHVLCKECVMHDVLHERAAELSRLAAKIRANLVARIISARRATSRESQLSIRFIEERLR